MNADVQVEVADTGLELVGHARTATLPRAVNTSTSIPKRFLKVPPVVFSSRRWRESKAVTFPSFLAASRVCPSQDWPGILPSGHRAEPEPAKAKRPAR
jgi:hypothetical protein